MQPFTPAALCFLCSGLVVIETQLTQDQISVTRRADAALVQPVLSVYPAASRDPLEGRTALLCVASDMVPPLVRFSWRRQRADSAVEESPPAHEEELQLREPGRITSIRLLDRDAVHTYKYRCSVQHEGGTVKAQSQQEVAPVPPSIPPSVPPSIPTSVPSSIPPSVPPSIPPSIPPSVLRMKLLSFVYTALMMKSLLSCCGISLLLFLTNNQKQAD
ncbi:uncharacterized protein LOC130520319 isoform X3 [Takifugu flavidus]|uniref:uncharacterized protein LOC130520319 isoform X3 n=1 Tax=Takifugu flavidus TaxID=433684 RepID=UPI0025449A8E|nr:uncharacterized protein LOC130520319 isoform X3 [Takifugu flavidus]